MSKIYYKYNKETRIPVNDKLRVAVTRPCFRSVHSFLWKFASVLCKIGRGKYVEYLLVNENNEIVSKAEVVSWIPIFSFMPKNGYHIGPCNTVPKERGKGYYPYLLSRIIDDAPTEDYYMIVDESNTSSIRGVIKAGFEEIGRGLKNRWGQYVFSQKK